MKSIARSVVSVGLIKYILDMPYTRKDGTLVTVADTQAMRARNKAKLDAKIQLSRPRIVSRG